jgi:hypothetical protein
MTIRRGEKEELDENQVEWENISAFMLVKG